jgi:DNA-binding SARP family transcriptional activator
LRSAARLSAEVRGVLVEARACWCSLTSDKSTARPHRRAPLRESAHAALIDVYLAEGNRAQARHHLHRYAALLWSELGIRPSAKLTYRVYESDEGHRDDRGAPESRGRT